MKKTTKKYKNYKSSEEYVNSSSLKWGLYITGFIVLNIALFWGMFDMFSKMS